MKTDNFDILQAARHCIKCSPELQQQGYLVRRLIDELKPDDSQIISLFKAGFEWPAGHLFYRALHATSRNILHSFSPDWFVLVSLRPRHRGQPRKIITPSFGSQTAMDKFRSRKSDKVLWQAIMKEFRKLAVNETQETLVEHLLGRWNYARFLDVIEASIPLTIYSPLEIAACNLVIDAAMPNEIKLATDFSLPKMRVVNQRGKYRRLPRFTHYVREFYQTFSAKIGGHIALLEKLKNEIGTLTLNPPPHPSTSPGSTRQQLDTCAEYVLLRALYEDLQSTDRFQVSAKANYHRLLWNGMRHVLLAHFGIYPEKIHKWMLYSAVKLKRVYPVSDAMLASLKRQQAPFNPRPFDLEPPDKLAARYQLNLSPLEFQTLTLERQALYVICCILIYSGRRAACLTGVELGHFKLSHAYADLVIPFSKGKNTAMFPAPISGIWPPESVAALRYFLENCRSTSLPPKTRLTAIAGMGNFIKGQDAALRKALKRRLSQAGIPSSRLHDGRIAWLTWMPVRILCARHRSLLKHPLLKEVVHSELFSPAALDQLNRVFSEGADWMFGMQRLVSHATPQMAATVYIRSLPLLIRLRHDASFGLKESDIENLY